MADVEMSLTSSRACRKAGGFYFGNVYHMAYNRETKLTRVQLGQNRPEFENMPALLARIRGLASQEFGKPILQTRVAAVGIIRLCYHPEYRRGRQMSLPGLRAERAASLVIARSLDDVEPVRPRRNSPPSADGFGVADRLAPSMVPVSPLIYLPATPAESQAAPVRLAMKAAPAAGYATDPYVALHICKPAEGQTAPAASPFIEQIVEADSWQLLTPAW